MPPATRQSHLKAIALTVGIGLLLTLPTDILPNPIFGRAVPVRWWEYLAVGVTLILTFLWFYLPAAEKKEDTGRLGVVLGATLFAVACPVCNKIVLLLVGTTGAMGMWAPIQPYAAAASIAALALALYLRVRRPHCTEETCAPSVLSAAPAPLAASTPRM